jgi:hypothetical protein
MGDPASLASGEASRPQTKWALGYLIGRARAFRSGNLPLQSVSGAARVAVRHGLSTADLNAHLAQWRLRCDPEGRITETNPHYSVKVATLECSPLKPLT